MDRRYRIQNLLMSLTPLVVSAFLVVVTYFAAFTFTVLLDLTTVSDATEVGVDEGIYRFIRYALCLVVFGAWYYFMKTHDYAGYPTGMSYESEGTPEETVTGDDTMDYAERSETAESEDSINLDSDDSSVEAVKNKEGKKKYSRTCPRVLDIMIILLLGTMLQLAVDGIIYMLSSVYDDYFESYDRMITTLIGDDSILAILSVVVLAPIAEEIMFRGITMKYAERAVGALPAVILQALLFAAYHGNLIQGVYALVIGLLLGMMTVWASGRLAGPILLHMVINLSAYLIPTALFDGNAIAIVIIIVAVVISVLLISLYRARKLS